MFINIRSLNQNFLSLYQLIMDMKVKPTIIGLSETWITTNRQFYHTLPGYDFIHNPSPTDHGGVGFLISNKITYTLRNDLKLDAEDCEDIWIELSIPKHKKITFGVIYRHPRHNFDNFMNKFCTILEDITNSNFIIGGDINIDLFKDNNNITEYIGKILSYGCIQTVKSATRYSSDFKSKSLIDHVYTNLKENFIRTKILTAELTDHLPIIINIGASLPNKQRIKKITIQDMTNFNPTNFKNDLFNRLLILQNNHSHNIDNYWNEFLKVFQNTINKHAPIKTLTKKETRLRRKPWITKEILKCIRYKNQLLKRIIKSKNKTRIKYFRNYRNNLNKVIKKSQKNYYKNLISKSSNNSKNLWKTINNLTNRNRKETFIEKIKDADGNIYQEKDRISNILNDYFVSMVEDLMRGRVQECEVGKDTVRLGTVRRVQKSFFLKPITSNFIENFINKMKIRKSNRTNAPKTIFLKASSTIISPILAEIFNQFLEQGIYPQELKLAEIIPIYKSGTKLDPKHWRPINLLSPFTKIYENYLYNELLNFLNKNNVLYNLQYGFREGSSTELAVTQIVDEISKTLDNNSINCTVFLDLAKAFNTVNHEILLKKLEWYGIRGVVLNLLRSYLSQRQQYTKANGYESNTQTINSGIPQGSTLGPLLFLIYVNDLPKATNMKVRLFADDACLSLDGNDPISLEQQINQELENVVLWMKQNKLFLNFEKSNFMIFSKKLNKDANFSIKLGDVGLKRVNETKYLGVILDDKLSWEPHLKHLKNKLIRQCYALHKIKDFININILKQVYYTLIYPHLQYAITAWGNTNKTYLQTIFIMQKSILKIILSKPKRTESTPLFKELGFLKLEDIYKFQIGKMMHKINNLTVGDTNLTMIKNIHNYNTRQAKSNNYFIKPVSTKIGSRSFSFKGPELWNKIPLNIRKLPFNLYKSKYKQYLLEAYNVR